MYAQQSFDRKRRREPEEVEAQDKAVIEMIVKKRGRLD
jgi:hypothetical protein